MIPTTLHPPTPSPDVILVVDDNATVLMATAKILEWAGYRVAEAASGAEALQKVRLLRPSLVLLDMVLPDISGYVVLRQIRADPELAGVSVVLISSLLVSPEHQATGLDAGADGYMVQPIAHAELVARVRLHLRQRELTEQLRASEARLVAAQAVAKVGSWEMDLSTQTAVWSEETHRIFETDPKTFTPTYANVMAFVHPDDRPEVEKAFAQSLKAGSSGSAEHRLVLASGRVKTVEEHWRVLTDRYGQPQRALGTCQDITERRQADQQIRERDAMLRMAGRTARLGAWTIELPERTLTWSEENCVIHDVPPGYRPTLEEGIRYFHPEHRAEVIRYLEVCERDGTPYEFILPKITAKGRRIWVRSIGEAVRDAAGKIIRLQGAIQDITEQKRAEEALRQSEAELRALAESMPQMVWMNRPDGENFYINRRWVDYTGLSQEKSRGRGWLEAFHPEDRQRAWDAWRAAIAEDEYHLECRLRRADGAYRWMLIRGLPFRDASGQITKWIGTCTDIDDLKTSQRALRMLSRSNAALVHAESENLLLAEICQIAVEMGGFRMAWVGYAQDDIHRSVLPQAWAGVEDGYLQAVKIFGTQGLPSGRGPISQALRSGEAAVVSDLAQDKRFEPWRNIALQRGYRGLVALPLKDKERAFGVLGLFLSEVRELPSGELRVLQELADDLAFGIVNLRIRVERHLAQQQIAQQAALIDHAQDAILVLDLEHRITFWSRGAERLYGWSSAEVMGQRLDKLLKANPTAFAEANRRVREKGEWAGEIQKHTKSRTALTVNGRWTLLREANGQPKSILTIDTDITESKKLEAQFLRAQRMDSIGTLAGGIAHDLNNLLSPVLMGIGLLKQLDPRKNVLEVLTNIERSARRGSELVKQVLSYARGVEGARVSLHLDQVLREIESIVTNTFPKNVAFESRCAADLSLVVGDPTQIKQVVLNLCVNARDALPNGGRIVASLRNVEVAEPWLAANPAAKAGRYVLLEVADNGTGIAPEIIDRIFEPFFTTKELGKGTGLGLSTALGIVRSHGGVLNVSSVLGKGSVFSVYLPASTQALSSAPEEGGDQTLERGQGERILVVDDDATILDITKRTLEHVGYRVTVAQNGMDALSLYAKPDSEIALVLTDMMMPVMDGRALTVALRQLDPNVRIIGASGLNASSSTVATGANTEVSHFLTKPFSADVLTAVLRQVLRDARDE